LNFNNLIIYFVLFSSIYADESWKVYDDSDLAIINIYVDQSKLDWIYENVHSDSVHVASLSFQNAQINEYADSVGFRLRGNTSRTSDKKSFKIDFNHFMSGRDFYGVEKLNLNGEHNDPSIVRSKICWDLYQKFGIVSSRAAHAEVYINNEYYGLYISVEHIDDTFLDRNYLNGDGNLWKCIWPADLSFRGNSPEDYHPYWDEEGPYDLKTNKTTYDYSKLSRLIRIINQSPDSLEFVLNVKESLQYFAMNILTGSWDDYRANINNFYLYHEPETDIFHWIPFDYDNTFGVDWVSTDWSTIDPFVYTVITDRERPLIDHLFSKERYQNLFAHFLSFYNSKIFSDSLGNESISYFESRLESFRENNYNSALSDTYRTLDYGFSIEDYQNSFGFSFENQHVKQGLMEFINQRNLSLNEQLYFTGSSPIIYQVDIASNKVVLINEPFVVGVSAFGPLGIDQIKFHYKSLEGETWETVNLAYEPIPLTFLVEEDDNWEIQISLGEADDYIGYFTAHYDEETDRYPVSGYKNFKVVESSSLANIKINEILAVNDETNVDEFGEYDDWLELLSHEDYQVDLNGYYLTDKKDNLTKWQFQGTNLKIDPGELKIIWCDEDQSQGLLHTNFKLSSQGEFLALIAPDGSTIIDSVTFPPQSSDISYGRIDLHERWDYMLPSPSGQNQMLSLGQIKSPVAFFKLNSIYPNPFNSTINLDISIKKGGGKFEINLVSLLGKIILRKEAIDLPEGENVFSWNIKNQNISTGVYFVEISNKENHKIIRKILYIK
tara:strand:+ start:80 stop:2416 length:2337 start_codon:yes stop_codon:yes gene_type:complete